MKNTILRLTLASIVIISIGGCAATYKQPSEQEPSAQLISIHITDSSPSSTKVNLFKSMDCSERGSQGRVSRIGIGLDVFSTESKARIPINERVYLGVEGFTQSVHPGRSTTYYTCTNLISFIPEAGKTYTLAQKVFQGNTCAVRLIENESRSSPSSFEKHPVAEACKAKGL